MKVICLTLSASLLFIIEGVLVCVLLIRGIWVCWRDDDDDDDDYDNEWWWSVVSNACQAKNVLRYDTLFFLFWWRCWSCEAVSDQW